MAGRHRPWNYDNLSVALRCGKRFKNMLTDEILRSMLRGLYTNRWRKLTPESFVIPVSA